jgi:hypothetical protein
MSMATQVEPGAAAAKPARKRKSASPFAGGIPMATIGLVATLIGFMPTFFIRLNQVDVPHLIHGWTMIAWLVLVLVQATLIKGGRYKLHRVLGWSSLALFVLLVGSSCQMIALMLSGKTHLPFEMAKFFAYSDILDMPLLLILFGGAIILRKNRHLHSRLVATTVLTSMVPAVARMFNILIWRSLVGLNYAMHPTYILNLTILGIAIESDRRKGRLRWPLPLAFGWFAFDYATQWLVVDAPWYDALCRHIAALA